MESYPGVTLHHPLLGGHCRTTMALQATGKRQNNLTRKLPMTPTGLEPVLPA